MEKIMGRNNGENDIIMNETQEKNIGIYVPDISWTRIRKIGLL